MAHQIQECQISAGLKPRVQSKNYLVQNFPELDMNLLNVQEIWCQQRESDFGEKVLTCKSPLPIPVTALLNISIDFLPRSWRWLLNFSSGERRERGIQRRKEEAERASGIPNTQGILEVSLEKNETFHFKYHFYTKKIADCVHVCVTYQVFLFKFIWVEGRIQATRQGWAGGVERMHSWKVA